MVSRLEHSQMQQKKGSRVFKCEEVLSRTSCQLKLLHTINKQKLEYLGHTMRNPVKYHLLQLFMQDRVREGEVQVEEESPGSTIYGSGLV